MFCPHCAAFEGIAQHLQIERPCSRCSYAGNWNGTPIYTRRPHITLQHEAKLVAAQVTEAILHEQERRHETLN